MIRSTVLFATIFLAFIGQFSLAADNTIEGFGQADVKLINDIREYQSQYPDAKIVPFQRTSEPVRTNHYTLGRRVQGDRIVAQGNNNFLYQTPQDVQQKLWYPTNGVGRWVSFVEIWVDQTSNIGNAYIVSGGIGQRQITIVIEAKRTTLLNYRAAIYGY